MSFFFPNIMFERACKFNPATPGQIENHNYFNYHIRRYFGLGLLLSFIPSTQAYQARTLFDSTVSSMFSKIAKEQKQELKPQPIFYDLSVKTAKTGAIVNLLLLGPLWQILDEFTRYITKIEVTSSSPKHVRKLNWTNDDYIDNIPFYLEGERYWDLRKDTVPALVMAIITIIGPLKEDLIRSFINPVRLVENIIIFLHGGISKLIGKDTSVYIHAPVTALFWIILFPLKIVKKLADIPYDLVKNFIYKPLTFIGAVIRQNLAPTENTKLYSDDYDRIVNSLQSLFASLINEKINEIYVYQDQARNWVKTPLDDSLIPLLLSKYSISPGCQNLTIFGRLESELGRANPETRFYGVLKVLNINIHDDLSYPLRLLETHTTNSLLLCIKNLRTASRHAYDKLTSEQKEYIFKRLNPKATHRSDVFFEDIIPKILDNIGAPKWLINGELDRSPYDYDELRKWADEISKHALMKVVTKEREAFDVILHIFHIEPEPEPKYQQHYQSHWNFKNDYKQQPSFIYGKTPEQIAACEYFGIDPKTTITLQLLGNIKRKEIANNKGNAQKIAEISGFLIELEKLIPKTSNIVDESNPGDKHTSSKISNDKQTEYLKESHSYQAIFAGLKSLCSHMKKNNFHHFYVYKAKDKSWQKNNLDEDILEQNILSKYSIPFDIQIKDVDNRIRAALAITTPRDSFYAMLNILDENLSFPIRLLAQETTTHHSLLQAMEQLEKSVSTVYSRLTDAQKGIIDRNIPCKSNLEFSHRLLTIVLDSIDAPAWLRERHFDASPIEAAELEALAAKLKQHPFLTAQPDAMFNLILKLFKTDVSDELVLRNAPSR